VNLDLPTMKSAACKLRSRYRCSLAAVGAEGLVLLAVWLAVESGRAAASRRATPSIWLSHYPRALVVVEVEGLAVLAE